MKTKPLNILFLCTGNSCRSVIAEAVFNSLAPEGMKAMSAGSHPTGEVHPRTLQLLRRKGISSDGYSSKSWDGLPATPDIVITVCSSAAGETCPAYLGKAVRAHWGVDDPAKVAGTDKEIDDAFEEAYRILRLRIEAFLALPSGAMGADEKSVARSLEEIGSTMT